MPHKYFNFFFCKIRARFQIHCDDVGLYFIFILHINSFCIQAQAFSRGPGSAGIGTVRIQKEKPQE